MGVAVGCWLLVLVGVRAAEREWLVRTWQTENGLPDVNVTALAQTPEGYLWVGTPKGLARFDGVRFKVFDSRQLPERADGAVSGLYADRRGVLWIVTGAGHLLRYEGGHFAMVRRGNGVAQVSAGGFIRGGTDESSFASQWMWGRSPKLVEDEGGGMWVLMADGTLLRCRDGVTNQFTATDGLPPGELGGLCGDDAGRVWLVAGNKLYDWRGGKWVGTENAEPLGGRLPQLTAARTGGIWVAAPRGSWIKAGGSIRRFEGGQWRESLDRPPMTPDSLRSQVTNLLEDRAGGMWLGLLWNGIWHSEAGQPWQRQQNDGPLAQCVITCLYEDQQGVVWVGTVGEGLYCISPRPVTMLRLPEPAHENIITTSCACRDGSIWVGTDGAGAFRFADGKFEAFGSAQGLDEHHVCSIFEDRHGELWLGTWGGLFHYEKGGFKHVTGPPGLDESVLALFEDHAGRLWAGTPRGLMCRQDGQWSAHPLVAGDAGLDIRSLAEEPNGDLWVGTIGEGLFRVRNDQVVQFRNRGGFASENARALYCDPDGVLWIGTYGEGLYIYQNGRFSAFTSADGLPCDAIHSIFPDASNNLWLSSDNGIFSCSPAVLKSYQRGRSPALLGVRLTLAEGLGGRACSGSGQPVSCRTADGRFWVPDMRGVAVFDPQAVAVRDVPPRVLVESVAVDGTELAPGPGAEVRVPSNARRFEFHFTSPELVTPRGLCFKYKLEGMDPDWVDANNQRSANYSQLPPGEYRFRVMAGGADGRWHEPDAPPFLLRVVPRWWELRWVQVLAGTALAGAVAGFILLNQRRKHRWRLARVEQDRAMERERSRIARDIHDDLGAGLTQVALLSELARGDLTEPERAKLHLDQVFTVARRLARALDEIVWAINPKNDALEFSFAYICKSAQDFLRTAGISCRLDLPEMLPAASLSSSQRHQLYLAVQESLNNIIKHADATEVRLWFHADLTELLLEINDNGSGFVPPPADRPASRHGLEGMAARMDTVGGTLEVRSQPGEGTTIRLCLPLRRA